MTAPHPAPGARPLVEALATDFAALLYDGGAISPRAFATRVINGPLAPLLAEAAALREQLAEARATNRDLHRRAQKAERFRERHGGSFNRVLHRLRKTRHEGRAAETRATAAEQERDTALEECARLLRLLDLRTRQNTQGSELWCKAGEKALAGDLRPIHDRIASWRDPARLTAEIVRSQESPDADR